MIDALLWIVTVIELFAFIGLVYSIRDGVRIVRNTLRKG